MNARRKSPAARALESIQSAHRLAEEAHEAELIARRRRRAAEQALRDLIDGTHPTRSTRRSS